MPAGLEASGCARLARFSLRSVPQAGNRRDRVEALWFLARAPFANVDAAVRPVHHVVVGGRLMTEQLGDGPTSLEIWPGTPILHKPLFS